MTTVRRLVMCASAVAALLCIAGLGRRTARPVDLVPAPVTVSLAGPALAFAPACEVGSDAPAEDVYALRLVREIVAAHAGAPRRAAATLARVHLRAAAPEALPGGATADQGYALEVTHDGVVVTGATRAARLHGVETLRQLWLAGGGGVRAGRIVDAPSLARRGLSLDVSRGRMPTLAELVSILDLCAALKLNLFQLYLEDSFDYSRLPVAARADDAYDALTLRRVAAEARLRAIEFVPIVQTLAHHERLLSRPGMRRFAELQGSSMLAVTERATRDLVRSMVDDVLAASGSRAVHLGCDEAADLGRGASAARVRRDGAGVVFREHVADLAGRARTRWDAGAWIYADALRSHRGLAAALPRDLVLVEWDYDPASTFANLDSLASVGLDRVVTSPGLWDWSAVYPDVPKAVKNIEAATRAARTHGCMGSVLSSWGDNGAESLFGNDVFGLAWFAECAWRTEPDDVDAFRSRYCRLRFGDSAAPVAGALDALLQLVLPNDGYNERMVYRPVVLRRRTPEWRDAMAGIAARLALARSSLATARGRDLYAGAELDALRASSGRLIAAAERELTLDSLAAALEAAPAGDADVQARAAASLGRIAAAEAAAQAEYAGAWRARNREGGLDFLRSRFTAQRAALDSLRACGARGELRAVPLLPALAGDQP